MTPEFPHPLPLAHVPAGGLTLHLEADAAARGGLARRLGLLALHGLSADLTLSPAPGGCITVRGRMAADVEQACVVSLDPVRQAIAHDLAWRLLPDGTEPSDTEEDPDDIECPGGVADLGEALAQELALALDPYPRRPGATLPAEVGGDDGGPFAALARLKRPG